jgi:hypothetical protein
MLRVFEAPDDVPDLSFWGNVCFWVTVVIDMPVCFALLGLAPSIFVQIFENLSTIEQFGRGGLVQRRFPCYGIPESQKYHKPNPYDLLWPNNLR